MTTATQTGSPADSVRGLLRERRVWWMCGVVALLHVVGFSLLAVWAAHAWGPAASALGVGTGLLAYSLGVRHAFDIDHIAAIDNSTRALLQRGQQPLGTGFFFSLGHSSVVVIMTLVLCLGTRSLSGAIEDPDSGLHHWTGIAGTVVSAAFLLVIGLLNLGAMRGLFATMRTSRAGQLDEHQLDELLAKRGLLNRILRRSLRNVDSSWKLFPLGFLFGLGFDTVTEIGLLVLAGSAGHAGVPIWAAMALPILFAAGMSLFDTADGLLMTRAYGWSTHQPVRTVFYNLVMTSLSVFVAVTVGVVELAGLAQEQFGLHGRIWDIIGALSSESAGYVVVAVFLGVWALSVIVWRTGRFDTAPVGPRPADVEPAGTSK